MRDQVRPEIPLGASYLGGGRCRFWVWAPHARKVEVHLVSPEERMATLEALERGYHGAEMERVHPGALYLYRLDGGKERPDPASRYQPQGVHNPSQVVDPAFPWEDQGWLGIPLRDYVLYELHVGTFSPEGTFEAVIPHLEELKDLGITAVGLMPVAQFPGNRNWGYDGVYPFAAQDTYGGPAGFKTLVNACHRKGLAVVLDVVYNHLGPEGNYLRNFGPYFTNCYKTPWGEAVNFDGPHSDEVRRFFIENALFWITEFHIDGLRLDALHAIVDPSAYPFIQELGEAVHREAKKVKRQVYLFAESDRNDARLIRPIPLGGYGLDALWNDDFHHALHALLTEEKGGYYLDFGGMKDLGKAFREGFIYSGQYSPYRQRRHGSSYRDLAGSRFVVFSQNHDQVGNRMLGERLSQLLSLEGQKLAAAAVVLSPFLPLLFMGEEYGETAPFLYFISHSDPGLIEAVRRGRRKEFSSFAWPGEPPDPQNEDPFLLSKLHHELRRERPHGLLLGFYRELIRLRKTLSPLATLHMEQMEVTEFEEERVLFIRRWEGEEEVFMVLNFGDIPADMDLAVPAGFWKKQLDSQEERWGGNGTPVPSRFHTPGRVRLFLNPKALALFARVEEA